MKVRMAADEAAFNFLGYVFLGLVGIVTIYPFLVLIGSSFASEHELITKGYPVIPTEFSVEPYKLIFASPAKLARAYCVTVSITLVGTCASLFVSTMSAYVLSRKGLKYRGKLAFFLYFTTLFSGGSRRTTSSS